ncbi:MAG: hypothetical protein EOM23_01605 [Candidatus Moranbacteria bacterium]|nr:hypothetical protein [Candidatus Moranbacteria bacterium]
MQKRTITSAFKSWLRRFPNPLDLSEILERKIIVIERQFCVEITAMKEKSPNKNVGEYGFVGVTLRKFDNFQFNLLTSEEKRDVLLKIKPQIEEIEKKYGLKCYQFAPEREEK